MDEIKINLSKIQKVINYLTLLIGIVTILYFVFQWFKLPENVPVHYNFKGEADRIGSKNEMLIIPIIMFFLYIGITAISKFPAIWNTGVEITPKNQDAVYHNIMNLIISAKLIMVCMFSYIMIMSVQKKELGSLFIPIFLMILFGSIIYFIIKIVKIAHSEK